MTDHTKRKNIIIRIYLRILYEIEEKFDFLIFMLIFSTGKLAKLTLLEQTSKFIMLKINISSVPISHSISMLMRRHNLA